MGEMSAVGLCGGLGRDCVTKDLKEKFNMFEIIVDIHIPRINDECRGFAFVRFKNKKDVAHILKVNHEIIIRGRRFTVARAQKEGSPKPCPSSDKGKAPVILFAPT